MAEPIRYDRMVSENSFLGRYLAYMSKLETSFDYDFWCGIWLLSVACGRNLIIDRPRAPVYMNLYLTLVAESGVSRKSTSIRECARLASQIVAQDDVLHMIESKTTAEGLDKLLSELTTDRGTAQVVIAISELATFLGTQGYQSGMPPLLTDLYDAPDTRRGGTFSQLANTNQARVWVSMISASTPAWLMRAVNPAVVEGGYTSRCIFVASNEPKRKIAWPTFVSLKDDAADRKELLDQLLDIRKKAREYRTLLLSDGALSVFRAWYNRRKHSYDEYSSSFESREDAHVLRMAGFLCMNDETWLVEGSHIQRAIRIIERVKDQAAKLFAGAGERTKFGLGIEKLRAELILAGTEPVRRSSIYLKVRSVLNSEEFMALIDVLHEIGAIQRFELKTHEQGKATEFIRGTQLLVSRGLNDSVLERLS